MLRLGIISELGTGQKLGFVRVYFDEVGMVSAWLPLPSTGTKTVKIWQPIEVNSQVACLMDEYCEQGCVVAALWSNPDRPPDWSNENTIGVQFADGAKVYYDANKSEMIIEAPDSEINMTCKTLNVKGEVNITGDTSITGNMKATQAVEGLTVTATATDVGLGTHMHPTAAPGAPSPPTPAT